jgi:hypothetical protein
VIQFELPNLKSLNISENNIKPEGALALQENKWPHLIRLDIGVNNLREEGCLHLVGIAWKNL